MSAAVQPATELVESPAGPANRPLVSWLVAVRYVDAIRREPQERYGRAYLAWKAGRVPGQVPLPSSYGVTFAAGEVILRTIDCLLAQPAPTPAPRPRRRRRPK